MVKGAVSRTATPAISHEIIALACPLFGSSSAPALLALEAVPAILIQWCPDESLPMCVVIGTLLIGGHGDKTRLL